jgi:hypothetical protein
VHSFIGKPTAVGNVKNIQEFLIHEIKTILLLTHWVSGMYRRVKRVPCANIVSGHYVIG